MSWFEFHVNYYIYSLKKKLLIQLQNPYSVERYEFWLPARGCISECVDALFWKKKYFNVYSTDALFTESSKKETVYSTVICIIHCSFEVFIAPVHSFSARFIDWHLQKKNLLCAKILY